MHKGMSVSTFERLWKDGGLRIKSKGCKAVIRPWIVGPLRQNITISSSEIVLVPVFSIICTGILCCPFVR